MYMFVGFFLLSLFFNLFKSLKYIKYFPISERRFFIAYITNIHIALLTLAIYILTVSTIYLLLFLITFTLFGLLLTIFPKNFSTVQRIISRKIQDDITYKTTTELIKEVLPSNQTTDESAMLNKYNTSEYIRLVGFMLALVGTLFLLYVKKII